MTFNFNDIFKQEDWDGIILTDNPPCKTCEHKIEFNKLYPGAAYYDQPPECRHCVKSSEYTIRCIQKLAYLEAKQKKDAKTEWHPCKYDEHKLVHDGSWVDGRWYEWLDKHNNREIARMKSDIPDHFFPSTKKIKEEDVIAFRELKEKGE